MGLPSSRVDSNAQSCTSGQATTVPMTTPSASIDPPSVLAMNTVASSYQYAHGATSPVSHLPTYREVHHVLLGVLTQHLLLSQMGIHKPLWPSDRSQAFTIQTSGLNSPTPSAQCEQVRKPVLLGFDTPPVSLYGRPDAFTTQMYNNWGSVMRACVYLKDCGFHDLYDAYIAERPQLCRSVAEVRQMILTGLQVATLSYLRKCSNLDLTSKAALSVDWRVATKVPSFPVQVHVRNSYVIDDIVPAYTGHQRWGQKINLIRVIDRWAGYIQGLVVDVWLRKVDGEDGDWHVFTSTSHRDQRLLASESPST